MTAADPPTTPAGQTGAQGVPGPSGSPVAPATAAGPGGLAPVTVVGLDGRPLAEEAVAALAAASVVAGGRRQLAGLADAGLLPAAGRQVVLAGRPVETVADLAGQPGPVVVLASGDPGFFGIVRALHAAAGRAPRVLPAASSVAQAFARAGLAWDDAVVVTAHGRDPAPAVNACRRYPKVAVLTEPRFGPAALGAALRGLDRRLVVAERLGTPDERVATTTPHGAAGATWVDPNVVLVLAPDDAAGGGAGGPGWAHPTRQAPTAWALDEAEFEHRDGMITKAEARALALAWLGPGLGDLVWDVGAGSGSVAIECARLGAAVIAVDADTAACARIHANAHRHHVPVEVVHGTAPAALAALPDPDAVFVGGGGASLIEATRAAAARARRVVVVALATVERIGPVIAELEAAGLAAGGTMLHAARLAPLAGGHRLAATNPVVLLRGSRAGSNDPARSPSPGGNDPARSPSPGGEDACRLSSRQADYPQARRRSPSLGGEDACRLSSGQADYPQARRRERYDGAAGGGAEAGP